MLANVTPVDANELEQELKREYGVILPSSALSRLLGYATPEAFRKALSLNRLPVPVFSIAGRRGHFALVRDVAHLLAESRNAAAGLSPTLSPVPGDKE